MISTTNPGPFVSWLAAIFASLAALASNQVRAHEGHEALPTKGVTVRGDQVYLSPAARQAVAVSLVEIDLKELRQTVRATGSVVMPWSHHAYATTRVSGRISKVLRRAGEQVKAGEMIAEVESLELINQQLELVQYRLQLDLAEQTLSRATTLGEGGAVPGKQARDARSAQREYASAVQVTKQKLLGVGMTEEELATVLQTREPQRTLPIIAPIDGIVVHGDINPGQVVEPSEHLYEIGDLSKVWVQGMVVESAIQQVRLGQSVQVQIAGLPGKSFQGQVDIIAVQADAQSRTVPIWVTLTNPDPANPELRPGMFGSLTITTAEPKDAIAVPAAALIRSGAETYVFVQQAPGEYLRKNLLLGMRTTQFVEAKDGVYPGDQVVLKGSRQLSTFYIQEALVLPPAAQRNIGLQLHSVQPRVLEQVVTINGAVEVPPDRKMFASCQLPGKVSEIFVNFAQPVKRDELLAEVHSLEFQELQLELLQTHTRLELASQLLDMAKQAGGAIAQRQVLERETDFRKLQNQLTTLEERLRTIGLTSEEVQHVLRSGKTTSAIPIRSPLHGVLVSFDLIPGQVVKAAQPLFEIHDLSKVWVRGHVFQQNLPEVNLGQSVRVRIVSDPEFLATVKLVRTNNVLAASERVMSVWAELENSNRQLRNNMLASMTITTGSTQPTIAVPRSAILRDGRQSYVFVQDPKDVNRFSRQPVKTGGENDQFVEVKAGVKPGDVVAVHGVIDLQTAYASIR